MQRVYNGHLLLSIVCMRIIRLANKTIKAMMAIQKPVKKTTILVSEAYAVMMLVPRGIVEKSKVSPKNANPYFPFTFLKKVRRPKSKVKT